ncbi:hypothetical protein H8959_013754 [Pygathrix nigripes]
MRPTLGTLTFQCLIAQAPSTSVADAGRAPHSCRRPPHTHHALLTCLEASTEGKRPQTSSKVWVPRPAPRPALLRSSQRAPRPPRPFGPPTDGPRSLPSPAVAAGLGPAPPPLPAAGGGFPYTPPRAPGRRRPQVPRLSHEAPLAPRFALPRPRPPALRPHLRRWSRGGRQRGSTFAALAAQREAFLPSPTLSAPCSGTPGAATDYLSERLPPQMLPAPLLQTASLKWRPGLAAARFTGASRPEGAGRRRGGAEPGGSGAAPKRERALRPPLPPRYGTVLCFPAIDVTPA